jgi:hypothetical protein
VATHKAPLDSIAKASSAPMERQDEFGCRTLAVCKGAGSLQPPNSVIPTGMADFLFRSRRANVGHGVEGPWQHIKSHSTRWQKQAAHP